MAHVTGGGLTDNLPRILPRKTEAFIRVGSWRIPELFLAIQEHGEVEVEEMFRVFNMGIGMVLVVDPAGAGEVLRILSGQNRRAAPIGTVQEGRGGVIYDFSPRPAPGGGPAP